jgi:N,N'-diacetylbacillosaminyl-diphospho-undecaprenol alpha-1,3-N-acetylgalactosaminyltransferase
VGGGEREIENKLKALVKVLEPHYPVSFEGNVEDVLPHLNAAQIGVFPSFQEGLPLSLLEMMSCGLPVLVSDIDEFKEIITDGKNGIYFKVGNADDLHAKLEVLIDDRNLRDQLGAFARQFVVEGYDIKQLKEEYEKVYNTVGPI